MASLTDCNLLDELLESQEHRPGYSTVWRGSGAPSPDCDLCRYSGTAMFIGEAVVDGKTRMGPWALMCRGHFSTHGIGLGLSLGQALIKP